MYLFSIGIRFRIADIKYDTQKTPIDKIGIEKIGLNDRLLIPKSTIIISMITAWTKYIPKLYFDTFNTKV